MKTIKTVMMLVLMAGIASADSLEPIKTAYTNAVAKIVTDTQKQKDDALAQYGKNLVTVQIALKQKGDIDNYMVVDQEVKRFQTEKTVMTNASILLMETVNSYQKQVKAADLDSDHRKVDLLKRYISALGNLVKDLMAKDKLDDAKVVGDEKKAVEFMLADLASDLPKVEVKAVGPVPVPVPVAVVASVTNASILSSKA